MNNPLKKITVSPYKRLNKFCDQLTVFCVEIEKENRKLEQAKSEIDLRCQSLELEVKKLTKLNKKLQEENTVLKTRSTELRQELHEARFTAAAYERLADKAIFEKVQLKRKYCTPCTEGAENKAAKEVTADGTNGGV